VSNIKEVGINEVAFNGLYLPFAQQPVTPLQLVVKSSVPPSTVIDPVRQAISALDRDLPVVGVRTFGQRVDEAFRGDRFHLMLIGTFALVGLALAAIGLYGTMAYAVQQRTSEFGLRLALGAQRASILRLALGNSMRLGLAGTVLGLAAVYVLARALGDALYLVPGSHNGLIYGVTTTDSLTLAASGLALTAIAAIAGLVPARRAMRVDPTVALRCE
jgi:putative ABC transport system permease protein